MKRRGFFFVGGGSRQWVYSGIFGFPLLSSAGVVALGLPPLSTMSPVACSGTGIGLPFGFSGVPTASPVVLGALVSAACAMPNVKARKAAEAIRVTFVLMGAFPGLSDLSYLPPTRLRPSSCIKPPPRKDPSLEAPVRSRCAGASRMKKPGRAVERPGLLTCGSHDGTLGGVANLDLPIVIQPAIGSGVPIVEPSYVT
jgi:hypothetical protein